MQVIANFQLSSLTPRQKFSDQTTHIVLSGCPKLYSINPARRASNTLVTPKLLRTALCITNTNWGHLCTWVALTIPLTIGGINLGETPYHMVVVANDCVL